MSSEDAKGTPPKLEQTAFPGRIHLIDTIGKLQDAFPDIQACRELGIDTEWKPIYTKAQEIKIALVQLASEEDAWLIRINKIGYQKSIWDLLENPEIVKVGLSLSDDVRVLTRKHQFQPRNCVDLQPLARRIGLEEQSLKKLAQRTLGKTISKTQQRSNWEREELTSAQQLYAATDAWACLKIFNSPIFLDFRLHGTRFTPPQST